MERQAPERAFYHGTGEDWKMAKQLRCYSKNCRFPYEMNGIRGVLEGFGRLRLIGR